MTHQPDMDDECASSETNVATCGMRIVVRFLIFLAVAFALLCVVSGSSRAYISWRIEKDGAVMIKALEDYKSEHGFYPQEHDLRMLLPDYTGNHRFSGLIEWRYDPHPEHDAFSISAPSWIRVTKFYYSNDQEWHEMHH